ncbi:hypothetical protein [Pseudomonas sp.]|uniref:hypothetical protein n=1 Tax=Pseudomonas sp. TaxID=306 RepID=UPI003D6F7DCF
MIWNPLITAHLITETRELSASPRWQYPDTPGSAQIVELSARLCSPTMHRAFRDTPEGDYLLYVIEAYEHAMNDDWLPFEIIGLELEHARAFINQVARELELGSTDHLIPKLRSVYSALAGLDP